MFQRFPYSNSHELNLDWILEKIKQLEQQGDLSPEYVQQQMRIFNVKDFGAAGDGITDDTIDIQDALTAAAGGGIVCLPTGEYRVTSSLEIPAGVTVAGNNMYTTKITLDTTNDALFDLTHQLLAGMEIRDLALQSAASRQNYAILGGCSIAEYNSAIFSLSRLLILDFDIGIYGGGVHNGIGIFDSVFRDIWFENCNVGFWCCGSGNLYEHCRFNGCQDGIVLDKLSNESMDGGWMNGCIFIANDTDVYIEGSNIRPFFLNDCWFEQSASGVLTVRSANTVCPVLSFNNCMLSTHSTTAECVNFYNMGEGLQLISGCQFLQENAAYKYGYTGSNYSGTTRVTDCNKTDANGTVTII